MAADASLRGTSQRIQAAKQHRDLQPCKFRVSAKINSRSLRRSREIGARGRTVSLRTTESRTTDRVARYRRPLIVLRDFYDRQSTRRVSRATLSRAKISSAILSRCGECCPRVCYVRGSRSRRRFKSATARAAALRLRDYCPDLILAARSSDRPREKRRPRSVFAVRPIPI